MNLAGPLFLLFLGIVAVTLCAIHRHRCPLCNDTRPTLSGRITLPSGVTRRYTIRLEEIVGDWPAVPKGYVDERLAEQAFHSATLPGSQN
jgi:hypothetical protein